MTLWDYWVKSEKDREAGTMTQKGSGKIEKKEAD